MICFEHKHDMEKNIHHMIKKNKKIFVAGHTGLVGSAIVRKLKEKWMDIVINQY